MSGKILSKILEKEIALFQKELSFHLETRLQDQLNSYLQTVAQWFAYIIYTQTKFELNLPNQKLVEQKMPPLIRTHREFLLSDYDSLDQFLDEYNGVTCLEEDEQNELTYDSYRIELEQLTYSWVYQQFYRFVHESFSDHSEDELENICQTVIDTYHADHLIMECADDLLLRLYPCNVRFLFELGKENAKRQWNTERRNNLERQVKEEKKKLIAQDVWRKVEVMYYLKYTQELPLKINKKEYEKKLYPVLCDLVANGIQMKAIMLIGECYWFRFSNSVVREITRFHLKK